MSYAEFGMVPRPLAAYLPDICRRLTESVTGGAWVSALTTALIGPTNIAPQKMLKDIHRAEILACAGNQYFPAGSDVFNALLHLVFLNLHNCGYGKERPQVIEYRPQPELTLDEAVDRMISPDIPLISRDDFSRDSEPRWASFVHLLPEMVQEVLYTVSHRERVIERLRLKARAIGYAISMGKTPTPEERSFFLMMAPGNQRSLTKAEWEAGLTVDLRIGEYDDELIRSTWNLFTQCTQCGPASKFRKFVPHNDSRQLTFYYGPAPRQLVVHSGYVVNRGPFVTYEMTPILSYDWTAESQLAAIAERASFVLASEDDPFHIPPPVQICTPAGSAPLFSLDEPVFRLYYMPNPDGDKAAPRLSSFEVDYDWKLAGKVVSTTGITASAQFPGPQAYLYDLGFKGESMGSGSGMVPDISGYALIDRNETKGIVAGSIEQGAGLLPPGMARLNPPGRWYESVFYPDAMRRSVMFVPSIDTSILWYREGAVVLVPAFREHVLIPKSWLYIERPAEVDYIMSQLGLGPSVRRTAAMVVGATHALALMSRFFHPSNLPEVNLAVLAQAQL
jgi:hypothetical protein